MGGKEEKLVCAFYVLYLISKFVISVVMIEVCVQMIELHVFELKIEFLDFIHYTVCIQCKLYILYV